MITLAFYKGQGTWTDRVIRCVTRSPYSHVEMTNGLTCRDPFTDEERTIVWSSSGRDGGVRCKAIAFKPGHWEFVDVPWAPATAILTIEEKIGAKYDFASLLGSQFFNWRRNVESRWFCSEICAHALGMEPAHHFAPGDLYHAVKHRNLIYERGRQDAA